MQKLLSLSVPLAFLLLGCANHSSNMRVGTDQSYMSLRDQREASLIVKQYPKMPADATQIGKVDASRCHRNALQGAPSDAEVLIDLKAAAYAKGADGITDVAISSSSGLLLNCWSITTGTATAFTVSR